MWVGLGETDRTFWKKVAVFARKEVGPKVLEWDRAAGFPRSLWRSLGRKGLLGIPFQGPERADRGSATRLALALDAFAYGSKDLGIVNSWGVHSAMAGIAIRDSGNAALKRRYLPEMAAGGCIAAFALTEPAAGSHAGAIQTTARRTPNGYALSGQKSFVTNGPDADIFIVIARDSGGAEDKFSAFVVERGTPGLAIGAVQDKPCIRTSQCCDITLNACQVPADRLLGPPGEAMKTIALPALDRDRCIVWAGRLGRMRNILEDATAYAIRRVQFGQMIARHQAIQFKLAEIKIRLDASEALMSIAVSRLDRNEQVRQSAAVARYVLGEATRDAAADAMQIFGGYAFYPKNHVERYQRDAQLDGIGGGTAEIQKLILGRHLISTVDPDVAWMSGCVTPEPWAARARGRNGSAINPRSAAERGARISPSRRASRSTQKSDHKRFVQGA